MNRTTLQQALNALTYKGTMGPTRRQCRHAAIEALRAELAKPEPEPYGYVSEHNCAGMFKYQFHKNRSTIYWDNCKEMTPLFTKDQL